ncbi:PhaM family polyhydroxyalkanoate granule multifunctional regulatory protein [Roseateles sp. BYS180W]|uniref:PhaM family polyhydroxyalkanoate granule multifunctional regulatory protein n=1 Tax=Roseateles rivi TaxID=3299028 RepID=A0ABW7FQV1_9BURK
MSTPGFNPFAPGMDFFNSLLQHSGKALPGMSQWATPTLNAEELEQRIRDLRAVQFWLDQNSQMLTATIQALEVQRLTLSTLQAMNVPMPDLQRVLTPNPAAAPGAKPAEDAESAEAPAVDPMQWWQALTQQFGQIAQQTFANTAAAAPAQSPAAAAAPAVAKKAAPRRRGTASK